MKMWFDCSGHSKVRDLARSIQEKVPRRTGERRLSARSDRHFPHHGAQIVNRRSWIHLIDSTGAVLPGIAEGLLLEAVIEIWRPQLWHVLQSDLCRGVVRFVLENRPQ